MRMLQTTCRPGPAPRRRGFRSKGTATIEFVMVIPLLGIVVGLTFFFGWTMMHKHQALIAGRHAAWRRIETGSWPSEGDLDAVCFAGEAANVQLSGSSGGLQQTAADLVTEVGLQDALAEPLARQLLLSRFPAGRRAHVAASFDSDQPLWERFTGHINSRHGREGVTWRREEVNCWSTLRDQYYNDFDAGLSGVGAPANGMAQMVRRLYLADW